MDDGNRNLWRRTLRRLNRAVDYFRILCDAEAAKENFARDASIGLAARDFRKRAARTNHGIERASGGETTAKIEAIRKNALDAEMIGKRAHDVVEALANENHVGARGDGFVEAGYALGL